uniref:Uncharacterized protein n=1 Tax=Anguilla anguilla TaxID=7936 RepID=A0A0E9X8P3_ANGAN
MAAFFSPPPSFCKNVFSVLPLCSRFAMWQMRLCASVNAQHFSCIIFYRSQRICQLK